MNKAIEITDDNFEEIINTGGILVIDFQAEWCGPCKIVGPIVDELADEFKGKVVIGKINVDKNPTISAKFGIRSIPTILFFKNTKMVDKQTGAVQKSVLVDKINAQL